jgi:hypothetical protein
MKTKISDDFVRACAIFLRMPENEFPDEVTKTMSDHRENIDARTQGCVENYVGEMYYSHREFVEEYLQGQKLIAEIMSEK